MSIGAGLKPAFFLRRFGLESVVAGSSLLALIDDIASILDDIAVMSKVAAKKTAGVLGDDLALNAHQVSGVDAERELPVVWAVAKGSLKNKAILVPAALAISAFIPLAITPLLMIGGAYLCYEGCEKIAHSLTHGTADKSDDAELLDGLENPAADLVAIEKDKIKGAIRTDFILSAEIIVIALGTVSDAPFRKQVVVLCIVALGMTAGVYGLVAAIVKLDNLGLYLCQKDGDTIGRKLQRWVGSVLLKLAPYLMKGLSVVGTIAMFMVGGGILTHGIPVVHDWIERIAGNAGAFPGIGRLLESILPLLLNIFVGICAGALVLFAVNLAAKFLSRLRFAGDANQRS